MAPVSDSPENSRFATEADLVQRFMQYLSAGGSPWGRLDTITEWDYRTGIVDVLGRTSSGELVAFEAKLRDWKRASHQAYRNTSYAGRAYVVMPMIQATRAAVFRDAFINYGVGLCGISDQGVQVLIEAVQNEPLLPWLRKRALGCFEEAQKDECRHARSRRENSVSAA